MLPALDFSFYFAASFYPKLAHKNAVGASAHGRFVPERSTNLHSFNLTEPIISLGG